ncbi:vanadium-dependent haloperoxidase [Flagellimonas allohymeniacidonis]|uniref:Phosphatase PAP2 family protein n=1 Tax=Flagellimonas allohymeniacidonis TaxID=2517819 RepID=A0A4Q8QED1_9FLAO|nr:vanadium-dependent haloperoxidase [Allomuricauda hymeniacidonis]TAI47977.1 phosphatase PAP2 family protein [Allomuricauda hymeniacidonis]
MMKKIGALSLLVMLMVTSCQKKNEPIVITAEDYHASVDKVTGVMIHDIFSPPVASRIYAYPNIAAYEILTRKNEDYNSLSGQLHDFGAVPEPESTENLNYDLAALIAHMDLNRRLIFSEDRIIAYRDSLYSIWEEINEKEFNISKDYGLKVAEHVAQWMDKDNYKQTRTMPKFTVNSDEPSRWQPTPPSYMDGIEPHWNKIRPFVIDSAPQFKPTPPPPFSMEEGSDFFKEVKEVYDISNEITAKGDDSEEVAIAQFWDCNPYVSVTRGHLMFATKKITPGAHWIGIAKIASRNTDADLAKTVYTYTKTSIAIADAFISCWDEKYRSSLIRPETLINEHIDDSWEPVLQTPPFPEYTSGHSVVSGAASVALTSIYGDTFAFDDDTEVAYGLPVRSFNSFYEAADEAAISRMYGGIHYRAAVEIGVKQGRDLGKFVVDNLNMYNESGLASN